MGCAIAAVTVGLLGAPVAEPANCTGWVERLVSAVDVSGAATRLASAMWPLVDSPAGDRWTTVPSNPPLAQRAAHMPPHAAVRVLHAAAATRSASVIRLERAERDGLIRYLVVTRRTDALRLRAKALTVQVPGPVTWKVTVPVAVARRTS